MHMALALDLFLTFRNLYCGGSFTKYIVIMFPYFSQTRSTFVTVANMCVRSLLF